MTATIASRIRDRARSSPRGVALREKSLGIWQETTWAGYGDLVERAAHGMLSLGVRPGDRVAIQCGNRPEWLVADAGAVAARALGVGLDPASAPAGFDGNARGAGARLLVAEDQEHVDKALAARAELAGLEWIVYLEPRGVRDYDEPSLVWWPDLLARGEEHRREHPRLLDELAEEVGEDDPVTPDLTAAQANLALGARLHPDAGPGDFALCHLPLWQTAARLGGAWLNADAGVQLHFAEPEADLSQTLSEVEPSLLLAAARDWEALRGGVEARMGRVRARAIRQRLGLRKCRSALSISPVAPELAEWYGRLGLPLSTVEVT
jgi:long-chain acyl-CoA synthetase